MTVVSGAGETFQRQADELIFSYRQSNLDELVILGVATSREFHLRVMENEEYRRGEVGIQWLEQRLPHLLAIGAPEERRMAAAVAAALLAERDRDTRRGANPCSPSPARGDAWLAAARREGVR